MVVTSTADPFSLARFEAAQRDVFDTVLDELRAGRKLSHWMWFIFPQIAGLGSSGAARRYAISGIDEARAFLRHPVLGARLLECANLLLGINDSSAEEVLGATDAQKLRSSMTLFSRALPDESEFLKVLEKYFDGQPDPATLQRI